MSAGLQIAGSHGVFAYLYLCICVRPNTVHVRQAVKERDRIVGEELISPPASDAATSKQAEDKTKSGKIEKTSLFSLNLLARVQRAPR